MFRLFSYAAKETSQKFSANFTAAPRETKTSFQLPQEKWVLHEEVKFLRICNFLWFLKFIPEKFSSFTLNLPRRCLCCLSAPPTNFQFNWLFCQHPSFWYLINNVLTLKLFVWQTIPQFQIRDFILLPFFGFGKQKVIHSDPGFWGSLPSSFWVVPLAEMFILLKGMKTYEETFIRGYRRWYVQGMKEEIEGVLGNNTIERLYIEFFGWMLFFFPRAIDLEQIPLPLPLL